MYVQFGLSVDGCPAGTVNTSYQKRYYLIATLFQYFEVDPFENTSRGTRPVFSICIEAIVQTEEMPEDK